MQNDKYGRENGKVTIKDISSRLNVSVTSVHRALLGKEGVGDSLRDLILSTADEMGYERNYAASAIKRKTIRVAVVLPQDRGLYYEYIWRGIRDTAGSLRVLNVEVEELPCRDELHQAELLKQIADAGPGEYAGVVAFYYCASAKSIYQMIRLVSMNICTVLIDDEENAIEEAYSIITNSCVIGSLVGELTTLITPDTGTVLVSQGRLDSQNHISKIRTFTEYIRQAKPGLDVKVVSGFSGISRNEDDVYEKVLATLKSNPDTVLYYALTSVCNQYVVRAVEELGMQDQVRIIVTDLNHETAEYLRQQRVCAVVNQGAYDKGCTSLQLVADRVVKHTMPPQKRTCPINLIFKSNLELYEHTL